MATQRIYLVTIKGKDKQKCFLSIGSMHRFLFPKDEIKYFALAARLRRKDIITVGDFGIQRFDV